MKKLILVMLLLNTLVAKAQKGPEELVKKFFDQYANSPAKAVDEIYATNSWASRIRDGVEKMKQEVNSYTLDYVGKYYGYEPITQKYLSESFALYSYMIRYERQPMRITFEFYKPNDKWGLFSLNIDTQIDDEIEAAAKIFNMNLDKK